MGPPPSPPVLPVPPPPLPTLRLLYSISSPHTPPPLPSSCYDHSLLPPSPSLCRSYAHAIRHRDSDGVTERLRPLSTVSSPAPPRRKSVSVRLSTAACCIECPGTLCRYRRASDVLSESAASLGVTCRRGGLCGNLFQSAIDRVSQSRRSVATAAGGRAATATVPLAATVPPTAESRLGLRPGRTEFSSRRLCRF